MDIADVRQYWNVLRRWIWLVGLVTLIAGVAAFIVSRSLTPIYRATATLLINQAQSSSAVTSYNDILTSERLARTYGELMRKRPVLDQVIADLRLEASYEQLLQTVDVRPVRDTQLITLAVEHRDPQLAADVANAIANVFIARTIEEQLGQTTATKQIMQRQITDLERQIKGTTDALEQARRASGDQSSTRLSLLQSDLGQYQSTYAQLLRNQHEMALAEARAANAVRLAEPAVAPGRPVRPQVFFNTAIATLAGLLVAIGIVLLVEYLDDAVKTPEIVEHTSGWHSLGAVALVGAGGRPDKGRPSSPNGLAGERLFVTEDARSPVSEAFRILRTNIEFSQVDRACRVLMITSPNQGEGKSTIAVNLAAVIAQTGKRVLLIDCDLRRPTLHRTLGLSNEQGLTSLLAREGHDIESVVHPGPHPNLSALTSGPIPPNPSELLGSSRMAEVLERLLGHFDLLVVDTPPVLVVSDPMVLAPRADGAIVVVDASKTSIDALKRTRDALTRASANVLGVVMNKLTARSGGYYYNYYYRSYYGEDEAESSGKNGRDRRRRRGGASAASEGAVAAGEQ